MWPPRRTRSRAANRFVAWPPRASGPRWHKPRRNVPHARRPGMPARGHRATTPIADRPAHPGATSPPAGRHEAPKSRAARRSGPTSRPVHAAAPGPQTEPPTEPPIGPRTAGPRPQASGRHTPARPSAAMDAAMGAARETPSAARHEAPNAVPNTASSEAPPEQAATPAGLRGEPRRLRTARGHGPPLPRAARSGATAAPHARPCVRNGPR